MIAGRQLNLIVITILFTFGLGVTSPPAQAESIVRLIGRPIARFLLSETVEGRALVNQILGRGTGAPVTSTELQRFAATMDGSESWARFSLELEDRVASAQDLLITLRERALRLGGALDASAFLRRYALQELEASTGGLFGSRRLAFTHRAGTSLVDVREAFVSEVASGQAAFEASLVLEDEVASVTARIVALDAGGSVDRALLPALVARYRAVSLEVAVQSAADAVAYAGHRGLLSGLRPRFVRLIDRAYSTRGEVGSLAERRARNALRAEVQETAGWFTPSSWRSTP